MLLMILLKEKNLRIAYYTVILIENTLILIFKKQPLPKFPSSGVTMCPASNNNKSQIGVLNQEFNIKW